MNVVAYNPETRDLEKTFLTTGTLIGATVFKSKNTDRFANGNRVLVGEMSRERSEILTVSAVTATQLTLGAAVFPHDADDPIYVLEFDKLRIYRSTTGSGGSYDLLAEVALDVDNASGETVYDDLNALESYYYEICFYDSVNDIESDLSAPIPATGYARNQVGRIISDMAARIKDPDFMTFTIEDYISIMNDVNDDLLTQAKRPYRFLKKSPPIDVNTGDDSFPYPDDLWKIDYVEVNTSSAAWPRGPKEVTPIDMRFRRQQNTQPADWVREIAFDDDSAAVLFNPAARTTRLSAFILHYYTKLTDFTSMADVIQTPTPLIYKLKMWQEYYQQKADDDTKYLTKAKDYENKYQAEVMKLQREKNIKADGPKGIGPQIKRYRQ